jgi:general stress protein 26
MVVWIATRPVTRKVEQLRADPRATLYWFDAVRREYVTIMGSARLVDDLAEKERRRDTVSPELYPNWPDDYLLIEVTPTTLEVLGRGLEPDPLTWKPPTLEFGKAASGR